MNLNLRYHVFHYGRDERRNWVRRERVATFYHMEDALSFRDQHLFCNYFIVDKWTSQVWLPLYKKWVFNPNHAWKPDINEVNH